MRWKEQRSHAPFLPRLLFLALCFFCGVCLGQVLAGRVPAETGQELTQYLRSYLLLERGVTAADLLAALVLYGRYPLLAFLSGFASIGVVLLPLASVSFGFFLSFSVSCFTAAFGGEGVLLALGLSGLRCAVTLPAFFLLAVPAFEASASLARLSLGRGQRLGVVVYGREHWHRLAGCAAVLALTLCVDLLWGPRILQFLLLHLNT